ncbi:WW domain-binding protein 2 isoform X2 [Sitodiplosis mosellana]|uniref:WW domain-binding protein 2 isoform X2 n=1 Tax=Sitodiplosis mosellana TaxID=263140 RepID=UPI002445181E|nr:WW domain-binding protein 2 isoform X2 [Sitodiplosis mosellana]
MSLNTAHANNGVLIHAGEAILLFSENVNMEFSGQDGPAFKGTKHGSIYLTTHRLIFNAKKFEDAMKSFSFPFICLNDVEVEQPLFGANYIRGKVRAQPDGNFVGEAKFKMTFKSGGCIEFAQAALRAAHMAQQNAHGAEPPPYSPPSGDWHQAPPPAYTPTPGYYGWLPHTVFPNQPDPSQVYMHDSPPPYPGIVPNNPPPSYGNYGQAQPGYQQPGHQAQGYPQPGGYPSYPQSGGYGQPNSGNAGYPSEGGYPQSNPYPSPYPNAGGYPPQSNNTYPQVPNATPYGNPAPSYPQGGWSQPNQTPSYPGYPPAGGAAAGGYAPPPNSKEAEAAQSSYNPVQPNAPYAPPPGYNKN